jgi:FtsH-binding integral membrane protein
MYKTIVYTYLHLLTALFITGTSAQYALYPMQSIGTYALAAAILIVLILVIAMLKPGLLKYAAFLVLLLVMGQTLTPLAQHMEMQGVYREVMVSTLGIFLAMTALGFLDSANRMLGAGTYLFAALIGLVLGRIGLLVAGGASGIPHTTFHKLSRVLGAIGVVVFAGFIAYETQALKATTSTDYVQNCMNLYFDIVNTALSISDTLSGD